MVLLWVNFNRSKKMPRPHKLKVPYTTFNIVLPIATKEKLSKLAHDRSVKEGVQISISDVIRESINATLL